MKTLFTLLLIAALSVGSFAQQRITISAKGDTTLESSLPPEMLYAFENYKEAKIVSKDGTENNTRININLYTGDILFLTAGNQILVLAYPLDVRSITIGETTWLPANGSFWEVKQKLGDVTLLGAKRTRLTDMRKEGGYGFSSGTASVGRITNIVMDGNQIATPLPVGEYDFETSVEYMLFRNDKAVIANAAAFKKFFPDKKKVINSTIKERKIDFSNEADILALLEVCR
jgi:hypothetical protein